MNLPVVKPGEDINAWLKRSVPALVEQHQLHTEVANRLAKEAWQQVNRGGDLVSQMTGEDQPSFGDPDTWGENVVQADEWPVSTNAPGEEDPWPDPFGQEDFDKLVGNDPTAAADPAAATDPTAVDPATQAPGTDPLAPPPAASPADGVATLLSTLQTLTTVVESLQGLTQALSSFHPPASPPTEEDDWGEDWESDEDLEAEEDPEAKEDPEADPTADDPTAVAEADPMDAEAGAPAESESDPAAEEEEADPTKKKKPFPFGKGFLSLGDVPTTGYAVPVHPDRTRVLPSDLVSAKAVGDYIAQNADLWQANYLGGKVDEANGNVSFGAFRHVPDAGKAAQLCASLGQETYYNLTNGQAVPVPVKPAADWVKSIGFPGPAFVRKLGDYRDAGNLAVKSLANDRFGGYLCLWGDESTKDLGGEFFTPKTQELTAIFDVLRHIPAIYHHAGDQTVKSAVVGLIDQMEPDDSGLWVEAQARMAKAYKQYIQPLINQQALAWSSGALPRGREVAKSGEILRWPIVEGSLTPTPFEWRMAVQWPVEQITKAYEIAGLPTDLLKGTMQ